MVFKDYDLTFKDVKYFMDFYTKHTDNKVIGGIDDYKLFTNEEYLYDIEDRCKCLPSYEIWNDYYCKIDLINGFLTLDSDGFMAIASPRIFYNDNIEKCLLIVYHDILPNMNFVLISMNKDNIRDELSSKSKIEIEEKELVDTLEKLRKLSPYSINSFNPYIYINIDNIFDSVLTNLDIKKIYLNKVIFEDNIIEIPDINDEINLVFYSESNKDLSDCFYKLKLLVTI